MSSGRVLQKSVDRLSLLDGIVVAVGWCEGNAVPQIVVDGKVVPVQTSLRYERPDVARVHGRGFIGSGFRIVGVLDNPPTDNSKIAIRFGDGAVLRRTSVNPSEGRAHAILQDFIAAVRAASAPSMIEIGSRARSGNTYTHWFPNLARYTGVDISKGPNVDVVGDAHTLSSIIPDKYDFAFSVSVYEHLIMPWVAAVEMNKVLNIGGLVYVQSHPTWPLHEEPWDFFRFSKDAWSGLFNRLTGFEIIEAGYGIEAGIVARECHSGSLQGLDGERTYLLSACMARKIGEPTVTWEADPSSIYDLGYSH